MTAEDLHLQSSFDSDIAVSHVFFKQKANGIPLANAVANVAFNKANTVVAFGSSFVNVSVLASPEPAVSVTEAISTAEEQLDGSYDENFPAPQLEYLVKDAGSVALTHTFQVRNAKAGTWVQAFVDAHTGELVSVTDYVAHASVGPRIFGFAWALTMFVVSRTSHLERDNLRGARNTRRPPRSRFLSAGLARRRYRYLQYDRWP